MSGPKPDPIKFDPYLPKVPTIDQLDEYVQKNEFEYKTKPGNEAQIVWYDDSAKTQTEYALVYLHGFSASHREGDPTHIDLAKQFGMNIYLSRLDNHGLKSDDALLNMTATGLIESAQDALALGLVLGKKVILVGTSTGGTLALYLASKYPELVAGIVLYSPNVAINDPNAYLLNDPWGLEISRVVFGGKYRDIEADSIRKKYWDTHYRLEAAVQLEHLVEFTMKEEVFHRIEQPTFLGYYYKNEEEQDHVVSVSAMLEMFDELDTPESKKMKVAYPDAGYHVIACDLISDNYKKVEEDTRAFLQQKMNIKPVD